MPQGTVLALAYLMSEAINAGLRISDVLQQASESGALPPETVAAIRAGLKDDFAHARDFWGVDDGDPQG